MDSRLEPAPSPPRYVGLPPAWELRNFPIHDLRQLEHRRGTRAGGRQRARRRGGLSGQTRWRNNGGLQTFLQTLPNLTCFSPSFSKESFGGFVEFQWVTRVPNPKSRFPNFSSRPPPFGLVPNAVAPHSADSAVAIRVCSAVRRVAGLRGARSGLI